MLLRLASDYNAAGATLTATHTHRFDRSSELKTKLRRGRFERDQRAGTVRFGGRGAAARRRGRGPGELRPNTVSPAARS
jgi:catecholate siderophore receptor